MRETNCRKKKWITPSMRTEPLYETHSLACNKTTWICIFVRRGFWCFNGRIRRS